MYLTRHNVRTAGKAALTIKMSDKAIMERLYYRKIAALEDKTHKKYLDNVKNQPV